MRILIASDLHGSLSSLHFLAEKARELRPDQLILLGDLVYHGPRNPLPDGYDTRSVLKDMEAIQALPCPITCVRGNCDAEVDIDHLPFPVTENAWIHVDGLAIFASHGHRLPTGQSLLYAFPEGTVLLHGHTHIPRAERVQGLYFWNPGSLSLPKGGSQRSYAVYEERRFTIYTQAGTEVLSQKVEPV